MTSQNDNSASEEGAESVNSVLDAIRGRFAAEERRQDEGVAASIKARGVLELTDIVAEGDIDPASVAPVKKPVTPAQISDAPAAAAGLEQSISQAITEGLQAALMADPEAIPDAIEARIDALIGPLVRDWLDTNLPDIVARVVREEIAQRQLDQ